MRKKSKLTSKLWSNWWIDAILGISAILAIISSLYFLAYPNGGYQGGRNPNYNVIVLFGRQTWDLLHTWSGTIMIMAAFVHILIHWRWITGTASRVFQVLTGKRDGFGWRLTYNILLDTFIAASFGVCALSGVYFLIFPQSGPTTETLLFSRTTWDLIHTWSGVVMTMAAALHFFFHWKWIVNITSKVLGTRNPKMQKAVLVAQQNPEE